MSYLEYIKQSFELQNQKLYKEAIEVLYKVLSEETDKNTMVEVISQIGDLHVLLKNYERAIEQYLHVLELDPKHEHSENRLYEIYYLQEDYEKALDMAKRLCMESKKPASYVKYFNVLLKLNQIDEINKIYENFEQELKSDPNILYIISLIRNEDKKEILEGIVKTAPFFAEAKLDLALIYFNEGSFLEAEKLFNDVLAIRKDSTAYYYKALIQIKRKEFFHAIDNLHFAIKTSKSAVQEFYFELAKTYMEVNWFDEAITTIKRSITLCIEQNKSKDEIDKRYLLLAWVFEKQKDYDNALFNLDLIGENSPVLVQAQILKALIAYKKGETIKAKSELERIYRETPSARNDLTLLNTLGSIYKDLKLNKRACEFYKKHLEVYPNSIHTACELIDIFIDDENYDEAEKYIEKYSGNIVNASFLNSMARIAYRKKDYDKAQTMLNKLIEYDKNNAEAYYFKGLVLVQKNDFKEAKKFTSTALELNPVPGKYYAQAARIDLELGFFEEAMLYIKEAIEIEPNDLNYKKLAAQIAEKAGNKHEAGFWNSIVLRTETILKDNKRF